MILKIKPSGKDGVWGFVEEFKTYLYDDTGYVKVLVGIDKSFNFSKPYVYRKNDFVLASGIDKEMGIEKYIKAKKPFYSMLSDGIIAEIRAGLNYKTGEFLPNKTDYTIHKPLETMEVNGRLVIKTSAVKEFTPELNEFMMLMAKKVSECGGDRDVFLRSRF